MTDKQPDALRQAAWLKREGASCQRHYDLGVLIERQHAENETLRAGYAAARLEIESLKAAILAEREACAKVCEAHAYGWEKNPGNSPIAGFISASNCAGDIRLRSNAAPQPSPAAQEGKSHE